MDAREFERVSGLIVDASNVRPPPVNVSLGRNLYRHLDVAGPIAGQRCLYVPEVAFFEWLRKRLVVVIVLSPRFPIVPSAQEIAVRPPGDTAAFVGDVRRFLFGAPSADETAQG